MNGIIGWMNWPSFVLCFWDVVGGLCEVVLQMSIS
jgi:hypothetical protein